MAIAPPPPATSLPLLPPSPLIQLYVAPPRGCQVKGGAMRVSHGRFNFTEGKVVDLTNIDYNVPACLWRIYFITHARGPLAVLIRTHMGVGAGEG